MKYFIYFLVLTNVPSHCDKSANRRPFYVIGHMVNSIDEVTYFLSSGANVLELDVAFFNNGSIHQVFHGVPCDCMRSCTQKSDFSNYLQFVRSITTPSVGKYFNQLTLLYFDLKLANVYDKFEAGQQLAQHIYEDLWETDSKNMMKVVVSINSIYNQDVIRGFLQRFRELNLTTLLNDYVAFDGGISDLSLIEEMWERHGLKNSNIWQGDGTTNCFSQLYPDTRLQQALNARDSNSSSFDKVYHWTIDSKQRMRSSLDMAVDGIITNAPAVLKDIIENEDPYTQQFSLATIQENPFQKFFSDTSSASLKCS
ncbi:dermonecrotic toxin StSicTox-betaIB1i-like [Stegodyphus dumicola]|uniref:dermonecrotic toxin StSicTox-betaIB1i-like n=1 Tax=Stegodyphus dumicola TaxID=202533 RepID=UPI0015B284EB|nr:dermonecrotic toxin StSicTox-betaIB1i-like [Stegodyphus dumicola]